MKRLLCVLGLLFCLGFVSAQDDGDIPLPKSLQTSKALNAERKVKFQVGGTFGFQIGSYTAIEVAPRFGVYATDFLCAGITGTYMFMHARAYNFNSHTFGVGAFVEGYVWKQRIILHASYEYLNFDAIYQDLYTGQLFTERVGNHGILVGPGYRQKVGERVNIFALILFPVYQSSEYRPYSIPVYKVGVTVDI